MDQDSKTIDSLKADPKNPRIISKHDANSLADGMTRFGDLSSIVFNETTQTLVGGHQRVKLLQQVLNGAKEIVITQKFDQPDKVGTTALGYIMYDGRHFAYRVVQWPEEQQRIANVVSNRAQGEWNLDMLAEITHEISQLENGADLLKQTGQTEDEVNRLLKMSGAIEEPEEPKDELDENKLEFALTADQREVVEEALGNIKATRELQATQPRNINGSALFVICQDYLNKLHAEQEAKVAQNNETTTTAIPTES